VAARAGAAAVLLGHTLDDQAETVLLGLARGSGTRSLAGMAPCDRLWRRPFLELRRSDTMAVCRAAGLRWWDDPHNVDPAYARARVRERVLPLLEAQLGPGVAPALARTAMLARDDSDLLDTLAADLVTAARRSDGDWDVEALLAAPAALRSRVLRTAAVCAGAPPSDLTASHVTALQELLHDWHGQRGLDLPGRVRASRTATTLRLGTAV
jgi:tRNA(Ile)-lysidine synthase